MVLGEIQNSKLYGYIGQGLEVCLTGFLCVFFKMVILDVLEPPGRPTFGVRSCGLCVSYMCNQYFPSGPFRTAVPYICGDKPLKFSSICPQNGTDCGSKEVKSYFLSYINTTVRSRFGDKLLVIRWVCPQINPDFCSTYLRG